jgi:DNA-binding transcriptional regulator YiaG
LQDWEQGRREPSGAAKILLLLLLLLLLLARGLQG